MDKITYMRLSVIVPVYNVKQYLEKCVTSILEQSFKDFELILVDDGSTDGSGGICDEFLEQDVRIKVIHQKNQGVSVARNVGINISKGEFVAFVDSDDWLDINMLQKLVIVADDEQADIVVCRGQVVEGDGRISGMIGIDTEKIMSKLDATKEILKDEDVQSFPWGKIYRKELFNGIEYPVGRIFEDTATTYKLFYEANKIVAIPYIGYNYRKTPGSLTNQKRYDVQKFIERELDNALAFHERYLFVISHEELNDILPLCAFKAYQMIRSFIHIVEHKNISLRKEQIHTVNSIFDKININDLSMFNMYEKLDLVLYKINKHLLKMYLRLIAKIHPIEFEIK